MDPKDSAPHKAGETAAVLSRQVVRQVPAQWGRDGLSAFFDAAFSNVIANAAHASPEMQSVQRVDELLGRIASNLIEPQNALVALMLIRSHAAYRAAALVAASGMPTDAYPQIRSVIETAGYALVIHRQPELGETWLRRNDGAAEKQAVRRAFTPSTIKVALENVDPGLLRVFDTLYEHSIDFGAHPNEKSLTANLSMTEVGNTKHYRVQSLHGNTIFATDALKNTARAGLFALFAFQHTMVAKFELLGVKDEMNSLRPHL